MPILLNSSDNPILDSLKANEVYSINTFNYPKGSAWFCLPAYPSPVEAVAGQDLKVLVAQFTTPGQISGQLQLQVFLDGDNQNEWRGIVSIPTSMQPISCDFDEDADGICDEIDDCLGAFDVCGVCNGPGAIYECGCEGVPLGQCDCEGNQLDLEGICGGECNLDSDNNGVCDYAEIFGCMYQWANNYNPEATRDDGTCESLCRRNQSRTYLIGTEITMLQLPISWPCFPFLAISISTRTVFGTAAISVLMSAPVTTPMIHPNPAPS